MSAFLDWLEKVLTWFFALAFGALLIFGGLRYKSHLDEESDPWLQARKMNTAGAYLAFLRQCHSCPQQADAYKALDPQSSKPAVTGEAPAYLKAQLANYQAALSRLTA